MAQSQTRIASTQAREPGSRSRRFIPLLLLSVLALVLLGLGIVFLVRPFSDDGIHSGGPLAPRKGYSDATTAPVDLKAPYSWGLIYLHNTGNDTAHVLGLDLGQVPSGLRVLGTYAVPGNAGIGLTSGYAANDGQPVASLDIPPDAIYEVIVGLTATTRGSHMIPNVRVRYTSGGTKYEATFHQSVALCGPKVAYPEGCPSQLG